MDSQILLRDEIKYLIKTKKKTARRLCMQTGIHPTAMSEFMNGKRVIMRKAAEKYFKHLIRPEVWSAIDAAYSLETIGYSFDANQVPVYENVGNEIKISEDQYQVVSDIIHGAIMICFDLADFVPTVESISQKMDLPSERIQKCLDRLVRLGLITKKDERYLPTRKRFKTTDGVPHPALAEHKINMLRKVEESLKLPVNEWDFVTLTFSLNPDDMPAFKAQIREMMSQFDRFQMRSKDKRVYSFLMALAPLSK